MEFKIKIPRILGEIKDKMARNLVKESKKEEPLPTKEEQAKASFEAEAPKPEGNIQVVTEAQLNLNYLQKLLIEVIDLKEKTIEGFKQVGVEFKDK